MYKVRIRYRSTFSHKWNEKWYYTWCYAGCHHTILKLNPLLQMVLAQLIHERQVSDITYYIFEGNVKRKPTTKSSSVIVLQFMILLYNTNFWGAEIAAEKTETISLLGELLIASMMLLFLFDVKKLNSSYCIWFFVMHAERLRCVQWIYSHFFG